MEQLLNLVILSIENYVAGEIDFKDIIMMHLPQLDQEEYNCNL